jgi:hypothetical protein
VIDVLERSSAIPQARPGTAPDERAARRTLLAQIERLERELAQLFASAWPRQGFDWGVGAPAGRGPRILGLGELERVRDALAGRVSETGRALRERERLEEANRRLIEDMLRDPARYHWVRVGNEDIGEPGCRHWHVVPRWGPVGMFANWWRVKISSGCPLAT